MIGEKEIFVHWPSAVEGEFEHPDLGIIRYWTGEKKNQMVVRFCYEGQIKDESEKIFFINLEKEDWFITHISTFRSSESKLKLIKNLSFSEQKELEKKYSTIIEFFIRSRKKRKFF